MSWYWHLDEKTPGHWGQGCLRTDRISGGELAVGDAQDLVAVERLDPAVVQLSEVIGSSLRQRPHVLDDWVGRRSLHDKASSGISETTDYDHRAVRDARRRAGRCSRGEPASRRAEDPSGAVAVDRTRRVGRHCRRQWSGEDHAAGDP